MDESIEKAIEEQKQYRDKITSIDEQKSGIIKEIKETVFEKAINDMTNNKRNKKILILKTRRTASRNNKKPINPTANQFNEWFVQAA